MHPITKKQKILYIIAAAVFVLLALALLFLLLQGFRRRSRRPKQRLRPPLPRLSRSPV